MTRKPHRKGLRLGLAAVGMLTVAAGIYFVGPIVKLVQGMGMLEKHEQVAWDGDSEQNLKAIHQALLLYQDSEDMLPEANGWMDAAILRLKTADLKEGEAEKKLQRPGVDDEAYGYAFNTEASQNHTEDIADPDLPLVFETQEGEWSANGTPEDIGLTGGLAVTISGEVKRLE
jgi:hypothetical protein